MTNSKHGLLYTATNPSAQLMNTAIDSLFLVQSRIEQLLLQEPSVFSRAQLRELSLCSQLLTSAGISLMGLNGNINTLLTQQQIDSLKIMQLIQQQLTQHTN